jgi:rare lipoprotein A
VIFYCAVFVVLIPARAVYAQQDSIVCTASFYARKFNGRKTASGEIFRNDSLTAAHKNLPFGTLVLVYLTAQPDKKVVVRINDRLPSRSKRCIDLSYRAASELGMIRQGIAKVVLSPVIQAKEDGSE